MDAHQISLKLFFDADEGVSLDDFIPVFHGWIRDRKLADEIMVDVADYAHVVDGPGVLLVCHEGHYVLERRGGRFSLSYHRKRGGQGDSLRQRLATPLRRLALAADLLEHAEPIAQKVKFGTQELVLRVQNRLDAPNTDETLAAIEPDLRELLGDLYGGDAALSLARMGERREMFTVVVKAGNSVPLEGLAAA